MNAGLNSTKTDPTSTLVSDGFTFSSQSAYIVYRDAQALLAYNTLKSTTGSHYSRLTLPYPAESLMSFYSCRPEGYWPAATINYQDLNSPPHWSVVSSQRPCHPWGEKGDSLSLETFPPSDLATQYTQYTNRPVILLPKPLTDVDPMWSTCVMGDTGLGLLDPPRALQTVSSMGSPGSLTAPNPDTHPSVTKTAQPASGVFGSAPARTSVVMTLPNGDRIVDFPPVGATIYSQDNLQSAKGAANSGAVIPGTRPFAFNPKATALPSSSGSASDPGQGNGGEQGGGFPNDPSPPDYQYPGNTNENNQNGQKGGGSTEASASYGGDGEGLSAFTLDSSAGEQYQSSSDYGHNQDSQDGGIGISTATSSATEAFEEGYQLTRSAVSHAQNEQDGGARTSPGASSSTDVRENNGQAIPYTDNANGGRQRDADSTSRGTWPAVKAGDYIIQAAPSGVVVVNGLTLKSQTPTGTISGVQVALQSSGIVIGGKSIQTPNPAEGSSGAPVTFNGHTVQAGPGSIGPHFIVDGHTLPTSNAHTKIGGNVVSMDADGHLSVLPKTLLYVPIANIPTSSGKVSTFNQAINPQRLPNGNVAVAGMTLSADSPGATVSGTRVSLLPNNAGVVIDYKTISVIPTAPPRGLEIVVGGQTLRPVGTGAIAVDGTTLSKNGQSIQLQMGQKATFNKGGLIVGTQTLLIATVTPISPVTSDLITDGTISTTVDRSGTDSDSTILPDQVHQSFISLVMAPFLGSQTAVPKATEETGVESASSAADFKTLKNGNVLYEGVTISRGGPAVTLGSGEVVSLEGSSRSSAATSQNLSASASKTIPASGAPVTGDKDPTVATAESAAERWTRNTLCLGWKVFLFGLLMTWLVT